MISADAQRSSLIPHPSSLFALCAKQRPRLARCVQHPASVIRTVGVAILLIATGCPGGHIVDRTTHQPTVHLPMTMPEPAPAAIATTGSLLAPESVLHDPPPDGC